VASIRVASGAPSLPIAERFVSIQGEGRLVGTPSSFVRVSGCNLRCAWCDSPTTSWTPSGVPTPLAALVQWCASGPRHVVITGGEPLLFGEVVTLSAALRGAGHHVTIETAGTVTQEGIVADLFSISPKLSHSTPIARDPVWAQRHEQRRHRPDVVAALMRQPWQLKFVVRAHDSALLAIDLHEIDAWLAEIPLAPHDRDRVLLMPECVDPARLHADYAALLDPCRARGFRLGERLHIALFGHTPGT
jgi:7-carboxy-7-deazaguanine synthase